MKIKLIYAKSLEYLYSTLALIVVFCLLSVVEVFENFDCKLLVFKLVNDFSVGLLIGLFFFPLYLFINYFKESLGIVVIKILFSIIAFIQLGLIGYSLTTHVNLGADLIGYSWHDIVHTLKTSVTLSVKAVVPFVMLPLVYYGVNYLLSLSKTKIDGKYLLVFILIFGNISWFLANGNKPENQNKLRFLISDIAREQNEKKMLADEGAVSFKSEFPLEIAASETKDVLSPFFNLKSEKPNIVVIMVEGLGSDFIDDGEYKGFTPFLDGLISKSLYWENFLSDAGRTFGVAPSLLASLPFGEKGFMEAEKLPKHNSLIRILKSNGYTTSYFSGDESNFDRKKYFLESNGIDHLIDINSYGPGYVMTQKTAAGFSWGYPDREIFRKTLTEINNFKQPRLDVIMTLSSHEPFEFPDRNNYLKQVDKILDKKSLLEKSRYDNYKGIFAALLYVDNSIKYFMDAYSKRPEYANTIFVITGDHRLVPVPQKDNLSRFHVPLYIYSPMLKKAVRFKSVSSHIDVTPSLVAFLSGKFDFKKLHNTSWLGKGLDTVKTFRNTKSIAFMRYKGGLVDYMHNDYFYSDNTLFKVDENFDLTEVSDGDQLDQITRSFQNFKKLNAYLTQKDKITKATFGNTNKEEVFKFTPEEAAYINKTVKGLDLDQVFFEARELAVSKEYEKTRLLCAYILNKIPNYGDVRTLRGRTFAWEKNYAAAEKELLKVITDTPFYSDSYSALMDVYEWSDQNKKAIEIGKKALAYKIDNQEVAFKLAKSFNKVNNKTESKKVIDSLLKVYPDKQEYLLFKKDLK